MSSVWLAKNFHVAKLPVLQVRRGSYVMVMGRWWVSDGPVMGRWKNALFVQCLTMGEGYGMVTSDFWVLFSCRQSINCDVIGGDVCLSLTTKLMYPRKQSESGLMGSQRLNHQWKCTMWLFSQCWGDGKSGSFEFRNSVDNGGMYSGFCLFFVISQQHHDGWLLRSHWNLPLSNYPAHMRALFNGQIDIVWHGPLAHIMVKRGQTALAGTIMASANALLSLGVREVVFGERPVIHFLMVSQRLNDPCKSSMRPFSQWCGDSKCGRFEIRNSVNDDNMYSGVCLVLAKQRDVFCPWVNRGMVDDGWAVQNTMCGK